MWRVWRRKMRFQSAMLFLMMVISRNHRIHVMMFHLAQMMQNLSFHSLTSKATKRPRRRVFQFPMENVSTRATSLELLVLMTETCSFASRTLMRGYLMLRKMIYRNSSPPL
ncbi:hypothetical protein POTOM_056583 [Populus tomentosa]|uniref:Uncharacterized protein n=1 Tax=Populus tomentosa TaxID=118781 RepID=A0A8X7XUZ2_POPTO|nr:hypothetical protein POTOM_056583 [Populus tomentosa]